MWLKNRIRMTLIKRIITDKIGANLSNPCRPCSRSLILKIFEL